MYKIYADNNLIYDSTLNDYKLSKGEISLEVNKAGSFTFTIMPDHYYYDRFVYLKTVIVVKRSGKILFRGRVLNESVDYWNNKTVVCEGELAFLQDSIIRPYTYKGTVKGMLEKFINSHNSQVDDFKKFYIGTITVTDSNNSISRENTAYESSLSNLNSRLLEDATGGYFYITHGEDGTEEIPTINYLAELTHEATQSVEFGINLKDYTRTIKTDDMATAVIPLGADVDEKKTTIKSVNNNVDYLYDAAAVAAYGWVFKTVEHSDITKAANLLTAGKKDLANIVKSNITIELTAIDLHLLDRNIESFNIADQIRVYSKPHNFDAMMLCNKQEINILRPDNDKMTLGYTKQSFIEASSKNNNVASQVKNIQSAVSSMSGTVNASIEDLTTRVDTLENNEPSGGILEKSTSVAGSTGAIYLYRYGKVVFATTNGAFRSSSDSIASGTKLAQTIPDGYKSVATVYAPGINKQSNNQRFSIGSDGSIYYYGGSAWTANAYFTACWITNDD